jgi:FKBP-type peptidyl-prolyl cis-trans isomerase FkpA
MRNHIRGRSRVLAGGLLLLAACLGEPNEPDIVACHTFLEEYGPAPGDTVTAAQGLRYIEINPGTGTTAAAGHTVDVNYSGYLLNGSGFDSSCGASLFRVTLGAQAVIEGFDLGIRGMKPGGVRRVIIPPALGYGAQQVGSIPPNSTLVFDLQLVRFVD